VSLFERLVALLGDAAKVTLAEQHRMNARIMAFPSEALYGGALRAHPAVADRALDDAPLEVVDTAGRGFEEDTPAGSDSKQNVGEAELVAEEVRRVIAKGAPPGEVAVISLRRAGQRRAGSSPRRSAGGGGHGGGFGAAEAVIVSP
jgi:superfamily I DNA and/or RNA helicase